MNTLARVAFVSFCLILTPLLAAQQAETKEQKVRRLLTTMKAADSAMQGIDGMIDAMRSSMPQVSEDFWKSFRAEVKPDELIDLLVPVYADNLDDADIEGLLRFFESPVGQKFIAKQGVILQQSMAAGQKWGEQLAIRAMQQLQKQRDSE